jgi:hypothetical protein
MGCASAAGSVRNSQLEQGRLTGRNRDRHDDRLDPLTAAQYAVGKPETDR